MGYTGKQYQSLWYILYQCPIDACCYEPPLHNKSLSKKTLPQTSSIHPLKGHMVYLVVSFHIPQWRYQKKYVYQWLLGFLIHLLPSLVSILLTDYQVYLYISYNPTKHTTMINFFIVRKLVNLVEYHSSHYKLLWPWCCISYNIKTMQYDDGMEVMVNAAKVWRLLKLLLGDDTLL